MFSAILFALMGLGLAALAAIVVKFVFLSLKNVIERIKAKRRGRVVLSDTKKLLAEAIQDLSDKKSTTSLSELEKLVGKEGVVECEIDEKNKVDIDSLRILQTDNREEKLTNILDGNDGLLIIDAAS